MSFFDYFIRCKEADKPKLLTLAEQLQILRKVDGQHQVLAPEWAWVPIGPIYRDDGAGNLVLSKAPDGATWWHANLRITMDLMPHAQAVYAASPTPELAAGLASIGSYFFVDANGRATRPADPAVVFA